MIGGILANTEFEAAEIFASKEIAKGYIQEALYPYANERGEVIYWRIRYKHPDNGDKWIRPMYRDDDGYYYLIEPPELKNKLKPLYGLHLLNMFLQAHVFVVEGEKCADALNEFFVKHFCEDKYIAVTSGSSTSANAADWGVLLNRQIIIFPDNDENGKNYAESVLLKLEGLISNVNIVDSAIIGLHEKGDVVDWLSKYPNATVQDLLSLKMAQSSIESNEDSNNYIIKVLSLLSPIEYDRSRKQTAKDLGIQVKTLDDLVKQERAKSKANVLLANGATLFKEIEPWNEPAKINDLLTELVNIFKRFAILPEHSDVAMALWVCFTWCIDAANTAPILAISSPEKRCGKTTVLSLLNHLVKRSLPTSNITPAALFRTIEEHKPTLLIDEADTFLKQSDDLRGILNSGHTRSTAYVLRTIGDEHAPKAFNTWGAKAIALIGKLPDTLHDRSIVIPLKRKLTHEKTERLHRTDYNFDLLKRKLARLVADYAEAIKQVVPKAPTCISDRAEDNWEMLLAIASLAGEEWEAKAIKAIIALSDKTGEPKTYGVTLLGDIKEIFESKNVDRIFSRDLITELCSDEEKPWATFKHSNQIDQRGLANLLKEFGISSKSIRIGSNNLKGYEFTQFEDAFSRYAVNISDSTDTMSQTNATEGFKEVLSTSQITSQDASDTLSLALSKDCDVVTAKYLENGYADEYLYEERAAIMQFDGGLSKDKAEKEAANELLKWRKNDY